MIDIKIIISLFPNLAQKLCLFHVAYVCFTGEKFLLFNTDFIVEMLLKSNFIFFIEFEVYFPETIHRY